jgi:two-component system LytT family response regulator
VKQVKVLLIDDERLAIVQLERMLNQLIELTAMESYQNPLEAVARAKIMQPDVVFLDIHMPEISGIQAAELIQEACPDVYIVFVTAYDEYAVKAFELNTVDYLLKPLQTSRIQRTIERIQTRREIQLTVKATVAHDEIIHCFKTIRFQTQGQPPELPKWRTAKAQELFAYLLHYRGQIVHKSTLLEFFFPELDMKRAMTQLYTAVYQIRQCIQKMNMNIVIQNSSIQEGYILDLGQVVLHTEQWEQELSKLSGPVSEYHERALRLLMEYEGDYLQDYGYVWAEHESERLRQQWLSVARELANYYLNSPDRGSDALLLYERMQIIDPYNDKEGLLVMKLYDERGYYDKVALCYERLQQTMEKELGMSVSHEVSEWYELWVEKRASKEILL